MYNFSLLLHVIAAIFLTGPLVLAPMSGLRAVRKRNVEATLAAARANTLYALLSLITLVLGIWVMTYSRYGFNTVWITISITLMVIALLIALLITSPALKRAAKAITETGTLPQPTTEAKDPANNSAVTETKKTVLVDMPESEASVSEEQTHVLNDKPQTTNEETTPPSSMRQKLETQYGRIVAASGISAVMLIVTTALMVLKPFGD